MSELTVCNFCNLQRYRKQAKVEGKTIYVRKTDSGMYIHKLSPGELVNTTDWDNGNPQIVAWFMALTDHCVC